MAKKDPWTIKISHKQTKHIFITQFVCEPLDDADYYSSSPFHFLLLFDGKRNPVFLFSTKFNKMKMIFVFCAFSIPFPFIFYPIFIALICRLGRIVM
jgi:hypothetical protein